METAFQNFLSLDDFKEQTGYDLTKRVELGDFNTKKEAASVFAEDCFNEIVELIQSKRGYQWTANFLLDMQDTTDIAILARMKRAFLQALKLHIIYRFEVGDPVASADSNVPRYSESVIDVLVNAGVIPRGI